MRPFLAVLILPLAAAFVLGEAASDKVEVKGPHICCKQCITVVGKILAKVDGVSDVKADNKTKTVTFTAKDDKAAAAGVTALVDGGFYGQATRGGKALNITLPAAPKGKADVVVIKDVHVCCGQCATAVKKLFPEAKVSFEDKKGPQQSVKIEGKDLDRAATLEALKKGGFYGKTAE